MTSSASKSQVERQLQALQRVSQLFGQMSSGSDLFAELTQQVADLLSVEKCAILLFDEADETLIAQAPAVGVPDELIQTYRVLLSEGSPGRQFWDQGEYFLANDVPNDPVVQALGLAEFARQVGVRSTLLIGMRLEGRLIGVIQPSNRLDGKPFDEDDIRLLSIYSNPAAVAIENRRLYQALQEKVASLEANTEHLNEVMRELEATTEAQSSLLATIRELSVPVVPVLNGIVIVPLVGHVDSERARQIMSDVLEGIEQHQARVVILDVTGVPVVDSSVANHLMRAAQAAQMLGAQTLIVGIRPEVAQTIIGLGLSLRGLITRSDLQSGIEYALSFLDRRIVPGHSAPVPA
jgi:anti-anti-sigma factor